MRPIELQKDLTERIQVAARELFGVELEQVASEVPPRTELGDVAFPVAFELAKQIKKATGEKRAPRAIAEQLKSALEAGEGGGREMYSLTVEETLAHLDAVVAEMQAEPA